MRVAYITSSVFPSAEANAVQVASMARALSDRSRVTLVARRHGGTGDREIRRLFGLPESVKLQLDLRAGTGALASAQYANRLRRMAQAVGFDAVYGRDPIGLLAAGVADRPCLYEIHHPPANRRRSTVERVLFRRGQLGLVFITEALAAWYRESRPETAQLPSLVLPDGADAPATDAPLGRRPGPPRLGYFGSLNAGKGMEVITALADRLGDAEIHVVGGRPDQVAAWRGRQSSERVIFHGWQPHAEVLEGMCEMDVLLAPYQAISFGAGGGVDISSYMSPLKIFEYMASGRPIVASDLPVLREVLADGKTALLRDPDDLGGWVAAVELLLEDRSLAAALSGRARDRLLGAYTWNERAARVLEFARKI